MIVQSVSSANEVLLVKQLHPGAFPHAAALVCSPLQLYTPFRERN